MNTDQQLYPSFRAIHGRDPVPGRDFDPDDELCQDDHDFFAGVGQYSDDVKPVQTVVYSGGNSSSLKATVADCWDKGYTDAVADGKDVLVNRGTWRIEGCSVEEFNILCAEIESEQSRELVRMIDGAGPENKKDRFLQFLRQGATSDGVLIQITVDGGAGNDLVAGGAPEGIGEPFAHRRRQGHQPVVGPALARGIDACTHDHQVVAGHDRHILAFVAGGRESACGHARHGVQQPELCPIAPLAGYRRASRRRRIRTDVAPFM